MCEIENDPSVLHFSVRWKNPDDLSQECKKYVGQPVTPELLKDLEKMILEWLTIPDIQIERSLRDVT